jgi:hypothetical protein
MSAGTPADSRALNARHGGHSSGMGTLVIALLTVIGLTVLAAVALRHGGYRGSGPGEADGDDGGGSLPRVPPQRPPEPPDGLEPDWWPDFEREFAEYAAGRRNSRIG